MSVYFGLIEDVDVTWTAARKVTGAAPVRSDGGTMFTPVRIEATYWTNSRAERDPLSWSCHRVLMSGWSGSEALICTVEDFEEDELPEWVRLFVSESHPFRKVRR